MLYAQYDKWLQEQYSKIVLEPNCVEAGPYLDPTINPNKPPWKMEWAVIFDDGMYFRVTENWTNRKGVGSGYRKHFSFHYGVANPIRDQDGIPCRSPAYPAIIRIDCDRNGPHLHYSGEDHIQQSRVKSFRISDAEPFEFVRAVMEHRTTGKPFNEIINFQVVS